MADKPEIKESALNDAAAQLKHAETVEKNTLPTKDDIEAEKKDS
eukprot:CAMPEP_0171461316 /NCGR_PEP_ID=MMETSP0945-20130129/5814_1 /TAXON_ID=109269 /ORGANISM="Vaucheria litorea, Strain CCMP2940" /LENGTH=43 /DNA_ID= /DNA_START= /DNA_END= /DNA_ORIENTATION=